MQQEYQIISGTLDSEHECLMKYFECFVMFLKSQQTREDSVFGKKANP
jgi:hypothetical protein